MWAASVERNENVSVRMCKSKAGATPKKAGIIERSKRRGLTRMGIIRKERRYTHTLQRIRLGDTLRRRQTKRTASARDHKVEAQCSTVIVTECMEAMKDKQRRGNSEIFPIIVEQIHFTFTCRGNE